MVDQNGLGVMENIFHYGTNLLHINVSRFRNKSLGNNAKVCQDNNVLLFQESSVRAYQDNSVTMFLDNNVRVFQSNKKSKNVTQSHGNSATPFNAKNVQQFQGKFLFLNCLAYLYITHQQKCRIEGINKQL